MRAGREGINRAMMLIMDMPDRVVSHLLGYIQGALAFGGSPEQVREAMSRDFPHIGEDEVDVLLEGLPQKWLPPPAPRILS